VDYLDYTILPAVMAKTKHWKRNRQHILLQSNIYAQHMK